MIAARGVAAWILVVPGLPAPAGLCPAGAAPLPAAPPAAQIVTLLAAMTLAAAST